MIEKIKGLQLTTVEPAPIGFSGDDVYLIENGYQGQDVVVKMSTRDEVYYEGKNLEWLSSKIKVPKVYEIDRIENYNYVIMQKLPGKMLQEAFEYMDVKDVIIVYAKAIRRFHDLPMEGIPHNHLLTQKIEEARNNVEKGRVKTQYFEREFKSMSAEEVYKLMLSYQQEEGDIVLCHGDVCMPNMMIDKNGDIGYIDVVQLGTCNRYLDIAIGLRSLRYNLELYGHSLSKEYIEVFKKAYGIEKLDIDKIMFYILLDELTSG
ncbi:MAG: aminoglycoside 3'-phosphotransferase [Coprobacillaceae bacterium]